MNKVNVGCAVVLAIIVLIVVVGFIIGPHLDLKEAVETCSHLC